MTNDNVMHLSVENAAWQDYRASNTGMVVFYSSDPVSEIPIREIPSISPQIFFLNPIMKQGPMVFGCNKSKVRNSL